MQRASYHKRCSGGEVCSGGLVWAGLRHRVQTDRAQVSSGWRLKVCRGRPTWRRRSAGALLQRENHHHHHHHQHNLNMTSSRDAADLRDHHPLVGHRHQAGLPEEHLLLLLFISKWRFWGGLQLIWGRGEGRRGGRNGGEQWGEEGLREFLRGGKKKNQTSASSSEGNRGDEEEGAYHSERNGVGAVQVRDARRLLHRQQVAVRWRRD